MKKTTAFIFALILLGVFAAVYWSYKDLPIVPDNNSDSDEIDYDGDGDNIPLKLPDGFKSEIFAKDIPNARVMAFDYSGNMLVSQTKEGKISHLTIQNGKVISQKTLLNNLNNPHGIAFLCDPLMVAKPIECQLYIAEEDQIVRYEYDMLTALTGDQTKIADLPSGGGEHSHFTRTIAFGPDERLYVSIGSSCNVCDEKHPMRATIYSMNSDGSDLKPYATGLRNSVFFTWSYVDGRMFATEMGRDRLGDDIPPDEINVIEQGGDYGWPYCYGKNDHDDVFEPDRKVMGRCLSVVPSFADLQAHSAPLGLAFIPEEGWPEKYWYNLLVAYHGSWNRSEKTGYKIVRIILDANGEYVDTQDFITGWLDEEGNVLGRPVDVAVQPGSRGTFYISDDKAGVIYKVFYTESDYEEDDNDDNVKVYEDLLGLYSPQENDKIGNPVKIKGEARGPMYFEAIFRIAVQDANHEELGFGLATSIGEWTTTEFVPFEAEIEYQASSTKTGYLVFEKENPSGLPENDLAISIPITFGN